MGIFLLAAFKNPEEDLPVQKYDYAGIFRTEYENACSFINNNNNNSLIYIKYGISPDFAWAIVFPELMRFNVLKDKIETTSLYTLYVNFGDKYADFSVGAFQMKPSFAERIEKDYLKEKEKLQLVPKILFDTANTSGARTKRIYRLENSVWQEYYLVLFIKLLELKNADIHWDSMSEKLLFFATAYNYGYWRTFEDISSAKYLKHYHTSLIADLAPSLYSYSSISQYYFDKQQKK